MVVLKQYQDSTIYGSPRYQRVFFCEDVTFNKYKIVYFPPSHLDEVEETAWRGEVRGEHV